jgi:gamma-glutamyltranspeptidase/glutathione hydrolase
VASLLVCPETHAAKVGREVFRAGGNAMDAGIAAAFAQGVTDPLLCGIGGGVSVYYHVGGTGERVFINAEVACGRGEPPPSWQRDYQHRVEVSLRYRLASRDNEIGYRSIMVPGFVRGFWRAYQRFGSGQISWADLLEPAIALAEEGFEIPSYEGSFWRLIHQVETTNEARGITPRWAVTEDARRLMLRPDGSPFGHGDRFMQPDLARTLRGIAEGGGDAFYVGPIGKAVGDDLSAHGSLVTVDDLAEYEVFEDAPLSGSYRGLEVVAQAFSNGNQIIEVLQILDHFDLATLGHNSAEYIELVSKAMRAASYDYAPMKGQTRASMAMNDLDLIATERAARWAELIKKGDPIRVEGGVADRGTTHLSAVDGQGNFISFNHSVGSGGSGVISRGLGFIYNGDMAIFDPRPGNTNSIAPGSRQQGGSSLAIYRDGKPCVVVGAPGGTRIFTSMIQTVLNIIDFGMDAHSAVAVPRFHSQDRLRITLEPHISDRVAEQLRSGGHDVLWSRYQARPQVVAVINGRAQAGSDPRGHTSEEIGEYPPYDWSSDSTFM